MNLLSIRNINKQKNQTWLLKSIGNKVKNLDAIFNYINY